MDSGCVRVTVSLSSGVDELEVDFEGLRDADLLVLNGVEGVSVRLTDELLVRDVDVDSVGCAVCVMEELTVIDAVRDADKETVIVVDSCAVKELLADAVAEPV